MNSTSMMNEYLPIFFFFFFFLDVGDLGKYLLERKLVSSIQTPMNTNYLPQTSTRIPPGFNDQPQLIPNRVLQNSTGQRSPSTP